MTTKIVHEYHAIYNYEDNGPYITNYTGYMNAAQLREYLTNHFGYEVEDVRQGRIET